MKTTLLDGRLIVEFDGTGGSVLVTRGKIINIYVEREGSIVKAGGETATQPKDEPKPFTLIQPQPASEVWHQKKTHGLTAP